MTSQGDLVRLLANRCERAEAREGDTWKAECPRCHAHAFWVMPSGYSCSNCQWQNTDLFTLDAALDEIEGVGRYRRPDEDEQREDVPFDRVLGPLLNEIDRRKKEPVDAVPTPFTRWNKACRDEGGGKGIARGWHLIVAGNPGMGKSLLALNIAAHAVRQGEKVGLISLEMSQMQAVTRYLGIFSNTPIRQLEHGDSYDTDAAFNAKCLLEEHYTRTGGMLVTNRKQITKLVDIEASMKWLAEHEGCRYFITDYLQLAWTGNAQHINDRITEVSHTIRRTSTDLHVVSVGLSQFNRSTSATKESPTIQGLMGGSALENDAEQILMIDHSSYEKRESGYARVKLLLGKNRHGPIGTIFGSWDYRTLRIHETEPW